MVIVVFRTRLRSGFDEAALGALGARMVELASATPGFISYKEFTAADGESVSIVEFESPEAVAAWREHAEHRIAQQRGRDEFFAEYRISVCTPLRELAWSR